MKKLGLSNEQLLVVQAINTEGRVHAGTLKDSDVSAIRTKITGLITTEQRQGLDHILAASVAVPDADQEALLPLAEELVKLFPPPPGRREARARRRARARARARDRAPESATKTWTSSSTRQPTPCQRRPRSSLMNSATMTWPVARSKSSLTASRPRKRSRRPSTRAATA